MALLGSAVPAALAAAENYRYSGPYTHGSLSIFLVHGNPSTNDKNYQTLSQAMKKNRVKVYETGSVGQLAIENVSDHPVYIQAGDIVKGGRQDRVLSTDMILPAKSGRIPIESFCVESSRWSKRGAEDDRHFSASTKRLVSKKQRLAAKLYKNQSSVWEHVAKLQQDIGSRINTEVKDKRSASSLQLTLENKNLLESVQSFTKAFSDLPNKHADAIGFAYAINGELNSADIYGSNRLFRKQWPRLLEAAATETIASKTQPAAKPPAIPQVQQWLADADRAQAKSRVIEKTTAIETREATDNVRFDTIDAHSRQLIHKNYISKK